MVCRGCLIGRCGCAGGLTFVDEHQAEVVAGRVFLVDFAESGS